MADDSYLHGLNDERPHYGTSLLRLLRRFPLSFLRARCAATDKHGRSHEGMIWSSKSYQFTHYVVLRSVVIVSDCKDEF
jgi:hypothetical protein